MRAYVINGIMAVLIIFSLIFETIDNLKMLFIAGRKEAVVKDRRTVKKVN